MKFDKRRASGYLLILGMVALVVGIATDNTVFSWAAVVLVLLSLIVGGRRLRLRRRG